MRLTEVLGNNSAPVEALLRALASGEVADTLAMPVRGDGHVPGHARRLSEAEVQAVVQKYRCGATVREIAAEVGLNRATVSAHLRGAGVRMRREVQPSERVRMAELHAQGLSWNEIGRRMGRDPKTVRAVVSNEMSPYLQRTKETGS